MSNDNKRMPGQQQPNNPSHDQSGDKQRQDQGSTRTDQNQKWDPKKDQHKDHK